MAEKPAPKKGQRGAKLIELLLDESRRAELAAMGLNNKRMAWQLGYSSGHFSRILAGQVPPSRRFERQAAAILKMLEPKLAEGSERAALGQSGQGPRVLRYCPNCGYPNLGSENENLLTALGQGQSTAERVAARLEISEKTVSNRLRRLFELGLVEREKQPGGKQWWYRVKIELAEQGNWQ